MYHSTAPLGIERATDSRPCAVFTPFHWRLIHRIQNTPDSVRSRDHGHERRRIRTGHQVTNCHRVDGNEIRTPIPSLRNRRICCCEKERENSADTLPPFVSVSIHSPRPTAGFHDPVSTQTKPFLPKQSTSIRNLFFVEFQTSQQLHEPRRKKRKGI